MDLPTYESRPLERSPLVQVATQISFEEVAAGIAHGQARRVQKSLGAEWSVLQAAPQVRTTLTPSGPVSEKPREAWRLLNKRGDWSLTINPDNLVLETRNYDSWGEMSRHVSSALAAVVEVFDPAQVQRVGLRYIDQVPLPDGASTWKGLIRDSLLGLTDDELFSSRVITSDHRDLLQLRDDIRCLFRHGYVPNEDGPPASFFLLDYDVFHEDVEPFNLDALGKIMDDLHDYAGSMFIASITETLYEWLRGEA
jgi:uncharacterized protein (TIGR04255 family)